MLKSEFVNIKFTNFKFFPDFELELWVFPTF